MILSCRVIINKDFEGLWSWPNLCLGGSIEERKGKSFSINESPVRILPQIFPKNSANAKHMTALVRRESTN